MITFLKNDLKTPSSRFRSISSNKKEEQGLSKKRSFTVGFIVFVGVLFLIVIMSWIGIRSISKDYTFVMNSSVTVYDEQDFPKSLSVYAQKLEDESFGFELDEIRYLHSQKVSLPFLKDVSTLERAEQLNVLEISNLHRMISRSSDKEMLNMLKTYLTDPAFDYLTIEDIKLLLFHEIPVSLVKEIQTNWPYSISVQKIVFYYRDGMTLDEFTTLFNSSINEGI